MKKGMIGFMIFLHLFFISQVEMKAVKSMDLADQVLKVQVPLFNFGNRGFGLYDPGDNQLKIFDWQFKLLRHIPIKPEIRCSLASTRELSNCLMVTIII